MRGRWRRLSKTDPGWWRESLVLLVLADSKDVAGRLAQLDLQTERTGIAGLRIIVVPRDSRSARPASPQPWVVEGNAEIHETYALFAASFSGESQRPGARHVEYLIDKQGYIRARWLPEEGEAWRDPQSILDQAALLQNEKPRTQLPDDHVH